MLTLKAAGLLDLDAGEIVRPGVLRIDGERIAGTGGASLAGGAGGPPGQVLGGIGFTAEHGLRRHVRRALVLDGLLGSARELACEAGALLRREGRAPRLVHLGL